MKSMIHVFCAMMFGAAMLAGRASAMEAEDGLAEPYADEEEQATPADRSEIDSTTGNTPQYCGEFCQCAQACINKCGRLNYSCIEACTANCP